MRPFLNESSSDQTPRRQVRRPLLVYPTELPIHHSPHRLTSAGEALRLATERQRPTEGRRLNLATDICIFERSAGRRSTQLLVLLDLGEDQSVFDDADRSGRNYPRTEMAPPGLKVPARRKDCTQVFHAKSRGVAAGSLCSGASWEP